MWFKGQVGKTQTAQSLLNFEVLMMNVMKPAIDGFLQRYVSESPAPVAVDYMFYS